MSFRASQTALRTAIRARPSVAQRGPKATAARASPSGLKGVRWTGQVSGQPANKDFGEMKESVKEEASAIRHDIGDAISAANANVTHEGQASVSEQIKSLGDLQPENMPKGAVLFGAAGVIPYAATSATTIYLSHQALLAETAGKTGTVDSETAMALLHHVENLQLGYGALILSFIGAMHWGFEFAGYNGFKGTPRYLMGLAPVAVAMPTVILEGELGLAAQFGAFVGAWLIDRSASLRGWTPRWYSVYRFWLTFAVGASMILTLGGTNYFGPSAKTVTTGRKLAQLNHEEAQTLEARRIENPEMSEKITGKVAGDVTIAGGAEDSYGLLKKREAPEEKKEGESKKEDDSKEE